jgi:hypothetical protein
MKYIGMLMSLAGLAFLLLGAYRALVTWELTQVDLLLIGITSTLIGGVLITGKGDGKSTSG